ncbi:peptide deformylase [bacterium]|nr:peptide deformylase [bacterium]
MSRKLLYYPEPVLRRKADEIEEVDEEVLELVEEMKKVLDQNSGLGLAAPQVGESRSLILVVDPDKPYDDPMVLINPEITMKSDEEVTSEEGCLCFPELYLDVKRANEIKVKAHVIENGELKEKTFESEKMLSRIMQHEIDHLNGILIIDHISATKMEMIKGKLKEIARKKNG